MSGSKWWLVGVVALAFVLFGCQRGGEPTAVAADPVSRGDGERAPAVLAGTDALALGTLKLEGTADAVTAAQAAELLPLWQMVASGALQGSAETEAVLKQIEGAMTGGQRAAIDAMGLTFDDVGTWMREQGMAMPERTGAAPDGQGGPGGPGAGRELGALSEDERAAMREQLQNMTAEERATRAAEMGFQLPEGQGGGFAPGGEAPRGLAGGSFVIDPLIALLSQRAGE